MYSSRVFLVFCAFLMSLYLLSSRFIIPTSFFPPLTHEFGVGFHIAADYGTAVVSYPNGSVFDVVRVDGSGPYKELMFKLSLGSSRRSRLYDKIPFWRDIPRVFASADIITLSTMIKHLRNGVESHVGQPVTAAVVTLPHLESLYPEDLVDTFKYLGLIYLADSPYFYGDVFYETAATYNGNGFGLCSNYTDIAGCGRENAEGPREIVLSISYTQASLTSTMAGQRMGFALPDSEWGWAIADMKLGYMYRTHNPTEEYYWAKVRDSIITPYMHASLYGEYLISKVLVHGDCALVPEFESHLNEALGSVMDNRPPIFNFDPVFAAARGAAEMAKVNSFRYQRRRRQETEIGLDGNRQHLQNL